MGEISADAAAASHWLEGVGIVPLDQESWTDPEEPGESLNSTDLAHRWIDRMFEDEGLTARERIRIGFGFVDLLDHYWAAVQLRWFIKGVSDPSLVQGFWEQYRRRLSEPQEPYPLAYCMAVDWLEDRKTAAPAFVALLGTDLESLAGLNGDSRAGTIRRVTRVLSASGGVPWCVAAPVYRTAAAVPELHRSIFSAVRGTFNGFYADLEPSEAYELVRGLELPTDTEGLSELLAHLAAGYCHRSCVPESQPGTDTS
jgi:hypothetical protein